MERAEFRNSGYFLVCVAVLFAAWGFHHELFYPDVQFSDVAFHLSVLKTLDVVVRSGGNPLDFWYDGVPYGFALFRAYQYLPYLFIYGFYRLSAEYFSLAQVLIGSVWLLAVALPVSFFCSLRLVGVRVLEAGIVALLSVLISDGSEYGMGLQNYTYGTIGIVTQLWAMVFLVPAIAASFQYLYYRKNLGLALLFSFLTFGCHVIAAVILMACIAVFSVGALIRNPRSFLNPVILLGLIVLTTAHQWFFVLSDALYINRSSLEPSWKYEGRGISYIVDLFWSGGLFDCSRLPVITVLLLASLCYCVVYFKKVRSESGGAFLSYGLVLFLLFFSLCCGRQIWGWLFNLLPVLKSLHVHRFAIGVHLFAIIVVASGVAALIRAFSRSVPRHVLLIFALLIMLRPAFLERGRMFVENFRRQKSTAEVIAHDTDLSDLLHALSQQGYGWTYIGSNTTWQKELYVAGYMPLDLFTAMQGIPTVGGILFHAFSLAGETLFDFDTKNVSHFNLFGIRNVVAPASWEGVKGFSLLKTFGRYALWTRESQVMFVADERFVANADYSGQTDAMRRFVQVYKESDHSPGRFIWQKMDSAQRFEGIVEMSKAGKVVAAVGFHPNWNVLVDGVVQKSFWVQPGFAAVEVLAGKHAVSFEYSGSRSKKYHVLLALFVILSVSFFSVFTKVRHKSRKMLLQYLQ
jgi:hypothetical protein